MDLFRTSTRLWFDRTLGQPTPIQRLGWDAIASGAHTLLFAPTGSGKTLAAFLWSLDQLHALPHDAPHGARVLYLSPLRALVHDVNHNLRAPLAGIQAAAASLGEHVRPVSVDVRTGDSSASERNRQRRHPAEILVTTPESLFLLLASEARHTLRTVQTVIVDEIHAVAGEKRGVHLALSLERLAALCDRDPQRIGLSATQRPLEEIASFLGGDRPVSIVTAPATVTPDLEIIASLADLTQGESERGDTVSVSTDGSWPSILRRILDLVREHRSTMVFTNSRLLCERVCRGLNARANAEIVRPHHGSIAREVRAETERLLKAG
jgi:ATP-dependent Lhr-like helicase